MVKALEQEINLFDDINTNNHQALLKALDKYSPKTRRIRTAIEVLNEKLRDDMNKLYSITWDFSKIADGLSLLQKNNIGMDDVSHLSKAELAFINHQDKLINTLVKNIREISDDIYHLSMAAQHLNDFRSLDEI